MQVNLLELTSYNKCGKYDKSNNNRPLKSFTFPNR